MVNNKAEMMALSEKYKKVHTKKDTNLMGKMHRLCMKDSSTKDVSDDGHERGEWKRPVEYVLSTVGYAVGIGSLYRFPYLVMRNGGGAFLVAFVFFMITCGFPLLFMESALGQYYQLSPIKIFNICPLFQGIGYVMVAVSTVLTIYYMAMMAWVIYYLYSSFASTLPWAVCGNVWNTNSCIPLHDWNISATLQNNTIKGHSSTEEFWERNVLGMSSGIDVIGGIQPGLAVSLSLAWFMVFVALCKGIASSRIAVYITATAPFVILAILIVRAALLPGSLNGVIYYLQPRWDTIANPLTWLEAFLAVFYSLGPAWGGIITLASYNPRNQNCFRNAIIVTTADTLTAIFCGFAVFSVLGFMADEAGVEVKDVVNNGPGLAFVTYPHVVASLPLPQFWAAIFFMLALFLGIDTQFGSFKTLTSGLYDVYPELFGRNKAKVTLVACVIGNIIGLLFITEGGMYLFQIVDWYFAVLALIIVALLESIVIAWIYGCDRFINEIRQVMPYVNPRIYTVMKYIWKFIIPPLMLAILIFTFARFAPPELGDYSYPKWAEGLGWTIAVVVFSPLPIVSVIELCRAKGSLRARISKLLKSRLPLPDLKVVGDMPNGILLNDMA